MRLSLTEHQILDSLKYFRAQMIWDQMKASFAALFEALVELYCAPASSAGVEKKPQDRTESGNYSAPMPFA